MLNYIKPDGSLFLDKWIDSEFSSNEGWTEVTLKDRVGNIKFNLINKDLEFLFEQDVELCYPPSNGLVIVGYHRKKKNIFDYFYRLNLFDVKERAFMLPEPTEMRYGPRMSGYRLLGDNDGPVSEEFEDSEQAYSWTRNDGKTIWFDPHEEGDRRFSEFNAIDVDGYDLPSQKLTDRLYVFTTVGLEKQRRLVYDVVSRTKIFAGDLHMTGAFNVVDGDRITDLICIRRSFDTARIYKVDRNSGHVEQVFEGDFKAVAEYTDKILHNGTKL